MLPPTRSVWRRDSQPTASGKPGAVQPDLELFLLRWNVGAFKALFRGSTILTMVKWMRHPRIHTKLDGHHPTGSSHHQKVFSIGDCFAFCSGIDMTAGRWDTRDHRDGDPGRHLPTGRAYKPWHDATTALAGLVAAVLGELCRDRWKTATGQELTPVALAGSCWPTNLDPDVEDVEIGMARTIPVMADQEPVAEVEALVLRQIASARCCVYIESQYLASRRIAEAIARRRQDDDGPEFVIINPMTAEGWLQPLAIDTARARSMKVLKGLGHHGWLAMYHSVTAGGEPIYAHAQIMVVDDTSIRIGSANLNNRSTAPDTECDNVLDAASNGGKPVGTLASSLRDGLLAEHLGCGVPEIAARMAQEGGVIAAVESRRGRGKTLTPYRLPELGTAIEWLADSELLDPESPQKMFEVIARRGLFWGRLRS